MTTESPDRKDLESKDKESLMAIAKAMGGKPTSRSTKSDLVDIIIELAGGESPSDNQSEDESSTADASYSADPMADARAEANQDVNTTNGNEENNGRKGRRKGKSKEAMEEWAGDPVTAEGHLDLRDDGYGFLRVNGFLPSRDDVYVPVKFVRQYGLRKGDHLLGAFRPANRSEKNPALLQLDAITESKWMAHLTVQTLQISPLYIQTQNLIRNVRGTRSMTSSR